MSIAPVSCDIQALTEQKGNLEVDLGIIEAELSYLSIRAGYMYQDYTEMLQDEALADGVESDPDVDTTEIYNWDFFKEEYEIAQTKLENQEKQIEMDKTNKQTKLTEITNLLESAQKRLEKNIESECKGMES